MDKRFLDIDGRSIHCRQVGPAETVGPRGPRPVLVFPPAPRSGLQSEPLLASFAYEERAVAVDLPGLGESWRPPESLPVGAHVRVALALIQALGWPTCQVVGEGVGAAVAIEFALSHAERVERVALIDPPLVGGASPAGSWPPAPRPDGSHWLEIWNRPTLAGCSPEERLDVLIDLYRGGAEAARVTSLLGAYPFAAALARVSQPLEVFEASGGGLDFAALHEFLRGGAAGAGTGGGRP